MAGVVGFEPTDDGTKNRCLTTWLHPNSELYYRKSRDCCKAEISVLVGCVYFSKASHFPLIAFASHASFLSPSPTPLSPPLPFSCHPRPSPFTPPLPLSSPPPPSSSPPPPWSPPLPPLSPPPPPLSPPPPPLSSPLFPCHPRSLHCHPRGSGDPGPHSRSCKRKCHDTRNMSHGALGPRFHGGDRERAICCANG